MSPPVINGFHPGREQPVQLGQIIDVLADLDQKLLADGAEVSLDLAPALGLSGQSEIGPASGPG
jgi:hypothetical protein